MPSFLTHIAEKIANNQEIPLENTIVVLPNKRARRELLRKLATHFTKPVFAPVVISVNEFMESLSSLKKIDSEELLMRLFDVYLKKNPEKNADFSSFLRWAPLFLQDINEIDLHLADAKIVFTNLSEIKNLETSFGNENITETQRTYLHFYNQLADLYADFSSALIADKVGYEGLIYKDAALLLLNHDEQKGGNKERKRYIFAGFNAVSPAELKVLHYFSVYQNAEFYFDTDIFYHERYGIFIEDIRTKLIIPDITISNHFETIPKKISCIGAPKHTAQVYQTIEIINKIDLEQGNLNDTVLVLADESLLLPFVHAYNTENTNITMGYPLGATIAGQQLLQSIDEEKQNNRMQKPVYHLKTQGFEFLQFLTNKLQTLENEQPNLNSKEAYSFLIKLVAELFTFLEKYFKSTTSIDFMIVEYFLKKKLSAATVPFAGNTREGLQIMGLLETRMLDFKNVIVLSMNEEVLPKGNANASMLLYEIRKHFDLPTYQRRDAIFGYHFFRLLQRAENIFLIYDNESTYSLKEKSRFIEQLAFEIKNQQLQETIHLSNVQYIPAFSFSNNETITEITKTPVILEKITEFPYSPTSLINYIHCPLQFYWKYIEKITVPISFDQANESAVIGTIIHEILKEIFTQLKQRPLQYAAILSEFEKNIDEILLLVFRNHPEIGNIDITQGKLLLAFQIVKKSISDYIKIIYQEWQLEPSQIIATETPFVAAIEVEGKRLCFTGTADRVEMRNNIVTILDYKTGKVDAKKLKCKIEEFEELVQKPEYSQLFQLLCYAWLYQNSGHSSLVPTQVFQCGIVAFQEIYKQNGENICYAEIDNNSILSNDFLLVFEGFLKQLFLSILDEHTAFCRTENLENCTYCDYKDICNL